MGITATTKAGVRKRHLRLAPPPNDIRHRALARLYERRAAVNTLIGALERYQQEQLKLRENGAAFTFVGKSS
jgi:hypothetical protein